MVTFWAIEAPEREACGVPLIADPAYRADSIIESARLARTPGIRRYLETGVQHRHRRLVQLEAPPGLNRGGCRPLPTPFALLDRSTT